MTRLARVAVLGAMIAATQSAYADFPEGIRWPHSEMVFFFENPRGGTTQFYRAFEAASKRWTPGNFVISMSGSAKDNSACKDRRPGMPVVNIARFSRDVCGSPYGPQDLAVAMVSWDRTLAITRADIMFTFNRTWGIYDGPIYPPEYRDRPDFRRVAVHELGHAAGLNHTDEHDSIMYPQIGEPVLPSSGDTERLRRKYAVATPSPPPGEFRCPPHIPYVPIVDMGSIDTSKYRLGDCLDPTRGETQYLFKLATPRTVTIALGADKNEVNVEIYSGASVLWQSVGTGPLNKSITLSLEPGDYKMRAWRQAGGTTYRVSWEIRA